ncbi:MAG: hypothetical protein IPH72_24000 [Sandaracinaceae bacterium]|nr:hypothetical protein [Sandaracinaceae bacterium]
MTELSRLDPLKLVSTAELLARRVHERFPDSGLSRLSKELVQLASDAKGAQRVDRPPQPQAARAERGRGGAHPGRQPVRGGGRFEERRPQRASGWPSSSR